MADSIDEQLARDELEVPFDSNDPVALAEQNKKAALRKSRMLRVVQAIMSDEAGREWMYEKLGVNCHIFAENRLEGERSARFEGQRGVGLQILDEIMVAAPELFWVMRKEALDRQDK